MRRLFTCLVATSSLAILPAIAAEKSAQPKLVVVLVVDGLPQSKSRVIVISSDKADSAVCWIRAWFSNAHQAHGVTVTTVGHAAVLTGAYLYQPGIISNDWTDTKTLESMYCTQDNAHNYIGDETKPGAGTSPANLRASTVGDRLRYATGNRAKVITVSGKDRGAILLAGKAGTAYMYMGKSGNFASSTYYMQSHPQWVQQYHASKPQDRFYGKEWRPLLADASYAGDASDDLIADEKIVFRLKMKQIRQTGCGIRQAVHRSLSR